MNSLQRFMRKVLDLISQSIQKTVTRIYSFIENKFPGGNVTLFLVTLNIVALCITSGLLYMAVISGFLACVSLTTLYVSANPQIKQFILKIGKNGSWWMDLILTGVLTILGFSLGPTMGLMGVMLGLDMTLMFSLLRWIAHRNPQLIENTDLNSLESSPAC